MSTSFRQTWALIYNPTAGAFRPAVPARLRDELGAEGIGLQLHPTAHPGHATHLAAQLGDVERIAVYGGDGTFNEVANGVGEGGPALMFLPGGTANVMAYELGLPRDPLRAARALRDGAEVPVRPGVVDGRRFLLMTGIGFDAAAVQGVAPALKARLGKGAYVWSGLRALLAAQPRLTLEGMPGWPQPVAWLLAARARHYGGPFMAHPLAGLQKEQLGIAAVTGPWLVPFLLANLGLRLWLESGGMRLGQVRCLRVRAEQPVHVQVDGDYHGQGRTFEIGLHAHTIRLCMPRGAPRS